MPTKLQLPKSAGALWRRIGPDLRDAMSEILQPDETWRMGGATILAAEWKHRDSIDIDLVLEPVDDNTDRLRHRRGSAFDDAMKRAGAERIVRGPRQVVVLFADTQHRLDIFETRTVPRGSERTLLVNGRSETVLDPAQILYGKLKGRGFESPVKDVYDVAVAIKVDRPALERAVNAIDHDDIELIAARWVTLSDDYQRDASRTIREPPEQYIESAADPARPAAEAILDTCYKTVQLGTLDGTIHCRTVCRDGTERTSRIALRGDGGINDALERSGLADYIRTNAASTPRTVATLLEDHLRRGGGSTVWTIGDDGQLPKRPSETDGQNDRRDHGNRGPKR